MYECESCGYEGPQYGGGTTITYNKKGDVSMKNTYYGCPICFSKEKFQSVYSEKRLPK